MSSQADLRSENEKTVLYIRHKFQKAFLSPDHISQAESMAEISELLKDLENMTPNIELETIANTHIHKVLKLIAAPEKDIRDDDVYGFKRRADELVKAWAARGVLPAAKSHSGSDTSTANSNSTKEKEENKKVEIGNVHVEPVTSTYYFGDFFHIQSEAFGRQTQDAIWMCMSNGADWDTPAGQNAGTARLEKQWKTITRSKEGNPNTVFVRASITDPNSGKDVTAGFAIWQQVSFIEDYGNAPSAIMPDEALEAGVQRIETPLEGEEFEKEKWFARQMFASLWKRRVEVAKEKAAQWEQQGQKGDIPAIFVLDLCAVNPKYQRRGVAQKLVQWGVDEARRRGGLECTTEASSMGRGAYMKLGFRPEEGNGDIVYEVDEEFEGRSKPSNVFLRRPASPIEAPAEILVFSPEKGEYVSAKD